MRILEIGFKGCQNDAKVSLCALKGPKHVISETLFHLLRVSDCDMWMCVDLCGYLWVCGERAKLAEMLLRFADIMWRVVEVGGVRNFGSSMFVCWVSTFQFCSNFCILLCIWYAHAYTYR